MFMSMWTLYQCRTTILKDLPHSLPSCLCIQCALVEMYIHSYCFLSLSPLMSSHLTYNKAQTPYNNLRSPPRLDSCLLAGALIVLSVPKAHQVWFDPQDWPHSFLYPGHSPSCSWNDLTFLNLSPQFKCHLLGKICLTTLSRFLQCFSIIIMLVSFRTYLSLPLYSLFP